LIGVDAKCFLAFAVDNIIEGLNKTVPYDRITTTVDGNTSIP
jgi:hypothetical protein